ncbi:MAG: hypothetical protein IJ435_09280 [Clostridia bacterium]|nr:hypothetical protein [Clostridia bacterium]
MKSKITTFVFAIVLFVTSAICIVKPSGSYSESERRPLEKMPAFTAEKVFDGTFMTGFEKYATDQFPARDFLRGVKAAFVTDVLMKKDNNSLFVKDGHISKLDGSINESMLDYAATLFERLAAKHAKGKVYFSIVPDKNLYLTENSIYPSMDYTAFIESMKQKTPFMEYVDITHLLDIDDYYKTDTHWRQEKIAPVAAFLANTMGTVIPAEYTENEVERDFYGVYHGQLALPFEADKMVYLTNSVIDQFNVTYLSTGEAVRGDVYNMKKAMGRDMYEMFLSGSESVVVIENPMAENTKELVIFRDSYASSLAPLLAQGYKKTTLVDIRYMQSAFLENYVDFSSCDVLFLYSTSVLNTSTSMK